MTLGEDKEQPRINQIWSDEREEGEQSKVWINNHGAEVVKSIMKQQREQDILEGNRILGRQPRQNKEGGKRH